MQNPQMDTPPFNTTQTSSASNSPGSFNQANVAKDNEKPRLTDEQKKTNHINSEQNRRNFLRQQFDRLSEMVPGTKGKARSEAVVLEKLVDFGHSQIEQGQRMIEEIERRGGYVDPEIRAKFFVPGRHRYHTGNAGADGL
ncbi:MAG: hypothetical protein HETSPECPRED_003732 [Heterodermia speciosa]|uniref:BHLH domain-containing protein n=1 Tax=Heterodermia speciosa TaxID=116794 RepID=A0A8H3F7A5_9LECA|nr:MAG: hypothetical protein HETSPECPRED_003732 [Heterodermia speciosa]